MIQSPFSGFREGDSTDSKEDQQWTWWNGIEVRQERDRTNVVTWGHDGVDVSNIVRLQLVEADADNAATLAFFGAGSCQ